MEKQKKILDELITYMLDNEGAIDKDKLNFVNW